MGSRDREPLADMLWPRLSISMGWTGASWRWSR